MGLGLGLDLGLVRARARALARGLGRGLALEERHGIHRHQIHEIPYLSELAR